MLLWVMQWISLSPGVSGFSFFPASVCGLGLEEFDNNLGCGYWRFDWTMGGRELVFVNVYLPLSSRFSYCIIISRF